MRDTMSDATARTEALVLLGQAGIPEPDIRSQVDRLCYSPAFNDRDRARELLRYLVDEALEGRVPRPPEIASKLGKKDFGPGDSYVRKIAERLRESLAEYYRAHAQPGEIRLELPDREYFMLAPKYSGKKEPLRFHSSPSPAGASILEPADGVEVYQRVAVKGHIHAFDPDLRAWLVVRTPCGDLYPQCRVNLSSPEWEHEVRIGRVQWESDEGAEYEINLVAANTDGDAAFYNYLKSGRDGFGPMLPSDATVLDTKRVTRRDIRPQAQR